MKVFVAIGNSDNKLPQRDWSEFLTDVRGECHTFAQTIQGEWYSAPTSPFQNACFCIEIHDENVADFKARLQSLVATYNQDSIAFDEAPTTVLLVPGRAT